MPLTPAKEKPVRRSWLGRLGWVGMGLLGLALIVAIGGYRAATSVPEFYAAAMTASATPQQLKLIADNFEREVLHLQNDLKKQDEWRLAIRESELNAWLAIALKTQFPELLPTMLQEPRVSIRDGNVFLAARYAGVVESVVSLQIEPRLTARSNEIALRLRSVRLGRLPISRKQLIEDISLAALNANLPLRWIEEEGDPVAIVVIPRKGAAFPNREIELATLAVIAGEIIVAGTSQLDSQASK